MPGRTNGKGTDEEKQKILQSPSEDIEVAERSDENEQGGPIAVMPEVNDDDDDVKNVENEEDEEETPSRMRLKVEAAFRSIRLCKFLLYFNHLIPRYQIS